MDLSRLGRGWASQGEVVPVSWLSGPQSLWDPCPLGPAWGRGPGAVQAHRRGLVWVGSTGILGLGLISDCVPLSLWITSDVMRGIKTILTHEGHRSCTSGQGGYGSALGCPGWNRPGLRLSLLSTHLLPEAVAVSLPSWGIFLHNLLPVWTHRNETRPLFP